VWGRVSVCLKAYPDTNPSRSESKATVRSVRSTLATSTATSRSTATLQAFVVPTFRKGRERWGTLFCFCGHDVEIPHLSLAKERRDKDGAPARSCRPSFQRYALCRPTGLRFPFSDLPRTYVPSTCSGQALGYCLSPLRGWFLFFCLPTAYAVGCILSPLRGWVAMGARLIAALKRRSSTVVSAFAVCLKAYPDTNPRGLCGTT
jgi:hypothetical protein